MITFYCNLFVITLIDKFYGECNVNKMENAFDASTEFLEDIQHVMLIHWLCGRNVCLFWIALNGWMQIMSRVSAL